MGTEKVPKLLRAACLASTTSVSDWWQSSLPPARQERSLFKGFETHTPHHHHFPAALCNTEPHGLL